MVFLGVVVGALFDHQMSFFAIASMPVVPAAISALCP
jgi:hypothetical protein